MGIKQSLRSIHLPSFISFDIESLNDFINSGLNVLDVISIDPPGAPDTGMSTMCPASRWASPG